MTDRYDSLFELAAANHGEQDWRLLKAIAVVESALDETAYRHSRQEARFYQRYILDRPKWTAHRYYDQPRVIAASYGLMQLMYTTATWMGFPEQGDWWLLFEPKLNIDLGARYFSQKLGRYHDREHALAAYNAGALSLTVDGQPVNAWYVAKVKQAYAAVEAEGE